MTLGQEARTLAAELELVARVLQRAGDSLDAGDVGRASRRLRKVRAALYELRTRGRALAYDVGRLAGEPLPVVEAIATVRRTADQGTTGR